MDNELSLDQVSNQLFSFIFREKKTTYTNKSRGIKSRGLKIKWIWAGSWPQAFQQAASGLQVLLRTRWPTSRCDLWGSWESWGEALWTWLRGELSIQRQAPHAYDLPPQATCGPWAACLIYTGPQYFFIYIFFINRTSWRTLGHACGPFLIISLLCPPGSLKPSLSELQKHFTFKVMLLYVYMIIDLLYSINNQLD